MNRPPKLICKLVLAASKQHTKSSREEKNQAYQMKFVPRNFSTRRFHRKSAKEKPVVFTMTNTLRTKLSHFYLPTRLFSASQKARITHHFLNCYNVDYLVNHRFQKCLIAQKWAWSGLSMPLETTELYRQNLPEYIHTPI